MTKMRLIGAVVVAATIGAPAVAQAQTGGPTFSCRASALKAPILGQPFVANNAYTPCASDHKALVSGIGIGSSKPNELTIRVSAPTATTTNGAIHPTTKLPIAGGSATSTVAFAHINVFNLIRLDVVGVGTTAGRKCLNSLAPPDIGGSATIAFLRLNGREIPISAYNTNIPVLIGTLRLNYAINTGTEVLTRALWLDLAGDANDIILGESRATATGTCL